MTYHPRLPRLYYIVNDNMTILHSCYRLRSAIPEPPLIYFRRPRNLSDILVRARLPRTNSSLNVTDPESPHGCSKCNRSRCKTYLYLKPAQKVKSHSTGLTYTIRTKSQCDTPNVIYVISCKECGIQCVGETKTKLCLRFANHVSSVKTKKNSTLWLSILTTLIIPLMTLKSL